MVMTEATLALPPQVSAEKSAARAQLFELLALPPSKRERKLASETRLQTYALATFTLQSSQRTISYNPGAARELAQLARVITSSVDSRTCGGTAALADLEAYALAMEGNALRVSGDLGRGLQAFTTARQVQENGGVDPDLMARIDHLESSLRRDLRQLGSALALLDRAEKIFKSLKAHDQLSRTTINRSNIFLVQGDFEQASFLLEGLLDLAGDPYLTLCARHNLADILVRSGRPKEAAQILEQTNGLYADYSNPLLISRRLWVEGIIARESGENLDLASELLTKATNNLVDHGYNALPAAFDLSVLEMKRRAGTIRRNPYDDGPPLPKD